MKDRGIKKWQPFNAVASAKEILNAHKDVQLHALSSDEIEECEEILKNSLYTHTLVEVTFVANDRVCTFTDYVTSIDSISKNITFSKMKINFRQIIKVNVSYL